MNQIKSQRPREKPDPVEPTDPTPREKNQIQSNRLIQHRRKITKSTLIDPTPEAKARCNAETRSNTR
ncbi:hypothetical protein [Enterococcus hirae]|uniref:hypothetical protein n=1 Tax=Enterococcus hirae TaxID=1354 RepID=UPI0010419507|nr:hypothetical protein [Enterococcus hirae]